MAVGKHHIEKGAYIFWDDLGTTSRNITASLIPGSLNVGDEFEGVDLTGVTEELVNYLAGHRNADVTARFHMNDVATIGATLVLGNTTGKVGTLTIQIGDAGVAPDGGEPELVGEMLLNKNDYTVDGGKMVHDVQWTPSGVAGLSWGTYSP